MKILNYLQTARNAVRKAIGLAPLPTFDRLPSPPTEFQKAMKPYAKAPQWFRLLMIYRITKRQYRKRRKGNSAKSQTHFRGVGYGPGQPTRRVRATGPNSYDEFKAAQAAARAQRKVLI